MDEEHNCEYNISIETALACPYECITDAYDNSTGEFVSDQFTVCSGRGICAADPSAGIVRCLCDSGWSGADCNTKVVSTAATVTDNHTGFQVAIAVISIILLALIGIVVYLKMKYNSLQKNLQRQLLEEDEDDMEIDVTNAAGTKMELAAVKDEESDSGDDGAIGDYGHNNTNDTNNNNDDENETGDNNANGTRGGLNAPMDDGAENNDLVVEDMDENERQSD